MRAWPGRPQHRTYPNPTAARAEMVTSAASACSFWPLCHEKLLVDFQQNCGNHCAILVQCSREALRKITNLCLGSTSTHPFDTRPGYHMGCSLLSPSQHYTVDRCGIWIRVHGWFAGCCAAASGPGDFSGVGVAVDTTTISTRRLALRPSGVSFPAAGWYCA